MGYPSCLSLLSTIHRQFTFNNRVIIKGKHNFKGFITGYLTFFILKNEIFDILTNLLHKTFYDESYKASPRRKGDQAKMAR